jgi:hypothetical protein
MRTPFGQGAVAFMERQLRVRVCWFVALTVASALLSVINDALVDVLINLLLWPSWYQLWVSTESVGSLHWMMALLCCFKFPNDTLVCRMKVQGGSGQSTGAG